MNILLSKKSLFFALTFVSLFNAPAADAGTASDVTVAQLVPGAGGFTFITGGGARGSVPACAATQPATWTVDVMTPQGQAIAASVITAYSMGKKLYISGTGTCPSFQPNGESVFFLATN